MATSSNKDLTTRRKRYWQWCCASAILVIVVTYSPLVLNPGFDGPWLFGLPRVLWAGFVAAVLLLILTAIGSRIHPQREDSS